MDLGVCQATCCTAACAANDSRKEAGMPPLARMLEMRWRRLEQYHTKHAIPYNKMIGICHATT